VEEKAMIEKQVTAVNEIIAASPHEYQEVFREITEYIVSLGYMPVKKSAKKKYRDFAKSEGKQAIIRIDVKSPRLAVKFLVPPEGREGFTHGFGYITLPSFPERNICEIKEGLKNQAEFYRMMYS
jgi:hypothetical protein